MPHFQQEIVNYIQDVFLIGADQEEYITRGSHPTQSHIELAMVEHSFTEVDHSPVQRRSLGLVDRARVRQA